VVNAKGARIVEAIVSRHAAIARELISICAKRTSVDAVETAVMPIIRPNVGGIAGFDVVVVFIGNFGSDLMVVFGSVVS
jgi:hypothetical protein